MTSLADLLASVFDQRKMWPAPVRPDEKPIAELAFELVSSAGEALGLASVDAIREEKPVAEADTAVFYSNSTCQAGLASISFGNSLIKQVVADISQGLPRIRALVTLLPMPGFTKWPSERGVNTKHIDAQALYALGAYFLAQAKDRIGMPFDAVARFHLGNGVILHQAHADADRSEKGLGQSAGLMVNYLYDLSRVAHNHERFATTGEVATSPQVRALCAQAEKFLHTEMTA